MTEYHDDELILRIKTNSPEASLHSLLKAIAASMRWAAHAEKTNVDPDNIASLAMFMEEITPEENQLRR